MREGERREGGGVILAFGVETSLAASETECDGNNPPLSHFQHRANSVSSEEDGDAVYEVTSALVLAHGSAAG